VEEAERAAQWQEERITELEGHRPIVVRSSPAYAKPVQTATVEGLPGMRATVEDLPSQGQVNTLQREEGPQAAEDDWHPTPLHSKIVYTPTITAMPTITATVPAQQPSLQQRALHAARHNEWASQRLSRLLAQNQQALIREQQQAKHQAMTPPPVAPSVPAGPPSQQTMWRVSQMGASLTGPLQRAKAKEANAALAPQDPQTLKTELAAGGMPVATAGGTPVSNAILAATQAKEHQAEVALRAQETREAQAVKTLQPPQAVVGLKTALQAGQHRPDSSARQDSSIATQDAAAGAIDSAWDSPSSIAAGIDHSATAAEKAAASAEVTAEHQAAVAEEAEHTGTRRAEHTSNVQNAVGAESKAAAEEVLHGVLGEAAESLLQEKQVKGRVARKGPGGSSSVSGLRATELHKVRAAPRGDSARRGAETPPQRESSLDIAKAMIHAVRHGEGIHQAAFAALPPPGFPSQADHPIQHSGQGKPRGQGQPEGPTISQLSEAPVTVAQEPRGEGQKDDGVHDRKKSAVKDDHHRVQDTSKNTVLQSLSQRAVNMRKEKVAREAKARTEEKAREEKAMREERRAEKGREEEVAKRRKQAASKARFKKKYQQLKARYEQLRQARYQALKARYQKLKAAPIVRDTAPMVRDTAPMVRDIAPMVPVHLHKDEGRAQSAEQLEVQKRHHQDTLIAQEVAAAAAALQDAQLGDADYLDIEQVPRMDPDHGTQDHGRPHLATLKADGRPRIPTSSNAMHIDVRVIAEKAIHKARVQELKGFKAKLEGDKHLQKALDGDLANTPVLQAPLQRTALKGSPATPVLQVTPQHAPFKRYPELLEDLKSPSEESLLEVLPDHRDGLHSADASMEKLMQSGMRDSIAGAIKKAIQQASAHK